MFHSARIRLTLWYICILFIVTSAFSLVIYRMLTLEVDRLTQPQRYRIEKLNGPQFTIRMFDPELIKETKKRIIIILTATDAVVLVLSGGLAYILAGRTLRPIKNMVDEQNRFISDASHEFRTPLTSLKSAFEVFLRTKKPNLSEAKTIINESLNEVDKMQHLSDSLLQLAQYQTPNGHTVFEKVSVKEILDEAIHRINPIAKKKQINIKTDIDSIILKGNKYGLIDVFVILLDNAVKYSKEKDTVTIIAFKKVNQNLIQVIDNGLGIEKKDIPHIFDRFYRADSARVKASQGGYGLGLSIAQKIVNMHKGKVSVESKKDKGTIFTVRLPIKN